MRDRAGHARAALRSAIAGLARRPGCRCPWFCSRLPIRRESRQNALCILASYTGLAFIVGPTLGGLLVDTVGWRSIFYLVLPLCAGALPIAWSAVDESTDLKGRRLDIPGQAAAIAALGGLVFAAIEGPHLAGRVRLAAAALGLAGTIALAALERGTRDGLVPFELFRSKPFSAALAIAGLMTFGMYALLFLMPLYFQTLRDETPLMAGDASAFRRLRRGLAVERPDHARDRGARATMASGMAAMGIGALLCALLASAAAYWPVAAALAVVGVVVSSA